MGEEQNLSNFVPHLPRLLVYHFRLPRENSHNLSQNLFMDGHVMAHLYCSLVV